MTALDLGLATELMAAGMPSALTVTMLQAGAIDLHAPDDLGAAADAGLLLAVDGDIHSDTVRSGG